MSAITISYMLNGKLESDQWYGWKDLGHKIFVDMFGRTRVRSEWGGEEPILHNPYGPAIQYANEEPIYYMHGDRVSSERVASAEKTETRTLELRDSKQILKFEICARFVPGCNGAASDSWITFVTRPGEPAIWANAQIGLEDVGNLARNCRERNAGEKAEDFFRTARMGSALVKEIQDEFWHSDLSRAGTKLEEKIKNAVDDLMKLQTAEVQATESVVPAQNQSAGFGTTLAIAAASAVATAIASKCSQSWVGVSQETSHAA